METRVLITGHNGYIGSVMAPLLAQAGHRVVGLDTGYFDPCTLVPETVRVPAVRKDIRDLTTADLQGFDAVIHLAALSNDPIGNLDAAWTREINLEGTVRAAERAKAAGVRRFLFSSSCIMYGPPSIAIGWPCSSSIGGAPPMTSACGEALLASAPFSEAPTL